MTSPKSQKNGQSSQSSAARAERQKLTEEQKNQNHLNSEHKRRVNIRGGMEELCRIVPGMEGKAAAEGEVLERTNSYVAELLAENQRLCELLEKNHIAFEPWRRMHDGGEGLPPGSSESQANRTPTNSTSFEDESPSGDPSDSSDAATPQ